MVSTTVTNVRSPAPGKSVAIPAAMAAAIGTVVGWTPATVPGKELNAAITTITTAFPTSTSAIAAGRWTARSPEKTNAENDVEKTTMTTPTSKPVVRVGIMRLALTRPSLIASGPWARRAGRQSAVKRCPASVEAQQPGLCKAARWARRAPASGHNHTLRPDGDDRLRVVHTQRPDHGDRSEVTTGEPVVGRHQAQRAKLGRHVLAADANVDARLVERLPQNPEQRPPVLEHLEEGADLRQLLEAVLGEQPRRPFHEEVALGGALELSEGGRERREEARLALGELSVREPRVQHPRADVEPAERLVQIAARPVHEPRVHRLVVGDHPLGHPTG